MGKVPGTYLVLENYLFCMKLFLTSTCISSNLREAFLAFLGKPPGGVKLYFIPTASDVEDEKFYTVKSMDDFAAIGVDPIWYSLKFKTPGQVAHELADADMIWVNGGNTFYLLEVARRTGFMETVNELVCNKGVMYGGTSAGTILATPSIEIASWGHDTDPNDVGIKDFTGFDFVNILTQVHYDPSTHRDILLSKKQQLPIYAIPNGAAIEVNDDQIVVYGNVEVL